MKGLNSNELRVLKSIIESAEGNGFEGCWFDELSVEGLTMDQLKGYVSILESKGIIYAENGEIGGGCKDLYEIGKEFKLI